MPWTRSILELPTSPVEIGSQETNRKFAFDLSNYLLGGSINSLTLRVMGGRLDGDYNWTDQTSALGASVTLVGTVATILIVDKPNAGWGYRTELTWQTAVSSGQTVEKFAILRCLY